MSKEISVPFEDLGNSQEITENNEKMFKKHDMDIHVNEVESIEDDHSLKKRVYKIKNTKYFGPWSHRG